MISSDEISLMGYQSVRLMSDGTWLSIDDKETIGWARIIAFSEEVRSARTARTAIATSIDAVRDSNRIGMAE